ncbi:hypothetical protein Mboo_1435 [Methanoregula boonei 6A8]|jgi:hypothetical protein|uniref:Uncharacterized protein n=1 Tax=Methanoregula boonei (strain DSM 21154 / JCM 14090 / 6A8) TaxID=456442 RepID=A7I892_METB6|nr:hypothetical protein [Methanoregula boonei]ABS55953.1 hypothetical protein Mboo_1435 [Methanoregula boonei 6A8]
MAFNLENGIIEPVKSSVANGIAAVRAINKKYEHPRITMSPGVKAALLLLRLYLIFLVLLLVYKFYTIITGGSL